MARRQWFFRIPHHLDEAFATVSFNGFNFLDKTRSVSLYFKTFHKGIEKSMKIRVEGLSEKPLVLSAREPISGYPALVQLQADGECDFLQPLHLEITAEKEYDHIRVHGRVGTRARFACSRCLNSFETDIVSDFTVFYSKATEIAMEEEVALTGEDLVSAPYEGDEIDFTREIEEQIVLDIPMKPLCREDCRGLCALCGADLNAEDCGCNRAGTGFPFSALKDFKVKK